MSEQLVTGFIATVDELALLAKHYDGRAEADGRLDAIGRALEAVCPERMAAIPAETLGEKLLDFDEPYKRLLETYHRLTDKAERDALYQQIAKEEAVHYYPVADFQLTVSEVEVVAEDYYKKRFSTIVGFEEAGIVPGRRESHDAPRHRPAQRPRRRPGSRPPRPHGGNRGPHVGVGRRGV